VVRFSLPDFEVMPVQASAVKFDACQHPFTVAISLVPGGQIGALLEPDLSRKYVIESIGSATASEINDLRSKPFAFAKQGMEPPEIGRLLGIDRKRVSGILADR
jgi:hypothetical protein